MSALTDTFTAIANAIRGKLGVQTTYTPTQMSSAIASIPTAKEEQTKSVTATTSQQTVTPDTGKVLSSVTVNPQAHSDTYVPATDTAQNDMSENHNYRYVDTTGMVIPSGSYIAKSNFIYSPANIANYKQLYVRVMPTILLSVTGTASTSTSLTMFNCTETGKPYWLWDATFLLNRYTNAGGGDGFQVNTIPSDWMGGVGKSKILLGALAYVGRNSSGTKIYTGVTVYVNGTSVGSIMGNSTTNSPTLDFVELNLYKDDIITIKTKSSASGGNGRFVVTIKAM